MGERHRAIVIGTGFAGLLVGYCLRKAGITDFVILEKADSVGGTWRENTYPGAECDVPSALYSYSFAPNPTWDFKWAKQPQILSYLENFATEQGLRSHIHFGAEVRSCIWEDEGWTVTLADGETLRAQHVVSAIGQLHYPNIPDFPDLDTFGGDNFHTAEWDHDIDHRGRDVAIIGNAATAVQVVPAIAPEVRRLTVYQRSPNWIVNKPDRAYSRFEHWLGARIPGLSRLYRFSLWCQGEYLLWPTIRGNPLTRAVLKAQNWWLLRKSIKDPELRARLRPDYPMGAKRILFSRDYYPALARDNVDLVLDPIDTFTPGGIRAGGVERNHDLVVFATGFQTNPFLQHVDVRGQGGRSIREHWSDGAHAYLGVSTAGFPNFHIMYGPNTNTGHTSIVYKLEGQAEYIIQLIEAAGDGALAVEPEVEDSYNEEVQRRLSEIAFSKVEASWYKDGDRVTNNWMASSREFRRRLRSLDLSKFRKVA